MGAERGAQAGAAVRTIGAAVHQGRASRVRVLRGIFNSVRMIRLCALMLLAGCAIPQIPFRTVYEDPVNYVRLEVDPGVLREWPPSHHDHPAHFSPEMLRTILLGLKVKEHRVFLQRWLFGDAPFVQAFTDEEISILSTQIAEALALAQYNERITFYLSQPQTSAKRVITSGGLYINNQQLHVLLGNWQIVYGIPTYGMIYDRRYPMRPTAAKGFDLYFLPADAVVTAKSSWIDTLFANTKDELIIDLNRVPAPDPVQEPATLASPLSSRGRASRTDAPLQLAQGGIKL